MPAFALVEIAESRRIPPLPLPLILFWPAVPVGFGLARLLRRSRPHAAEKLHLAARLCCELRGLDVDVDTADHKRVRIRFV